ncbi:MAG: ABC transporter permease [Methylacidiphilales bacterium]|nr:ABC transporter permease [Candidatus Methylacidiphilales bacterium]
MVIENHIGWYALYRKEIIRFLSVYIQTFLTPVISAFLFLGIAHLTVAKLALTVNNFPYTHFLVPGLCAMAMAMSAFSNPSFSLLLSKLQRNLPSIIMAPLSSFEFYSAYVLAATTRGMLTGAAVWLSLSLVTQFNANNFFYFILFSFLGSLLFAQIGYIAGIVAKRFEHLSAMMTFVITPLTFLSGGFYLQATLPETIRQLAHGNPVFYFMDGVRGSLLGINESSFMISFFVLVLINISLGYGAMRLTKSGYNLKQ